MGTLQPREQGELRRANASGARPVVFVHGLWLLAESWDPWRGLFEEHGFATLAPSWPGDPETVEEARLHPEAFARTRLQQITDHYAEVIHQLDAAPALVGHSFGGLIAQKLAGMGLAATTVAVDPAPFQGVLPLPFSVLKAGFPVLRNPANYNRAVALSYEEFRFAFANAVSEEEAAALYAAHAVAGPGRPLFQAAGANLNPATEARVDISNPRRGPLLILSGEKDHTVPWAIAYASYKRQLRNPGLTEIKQLSGRGHSLTIDSGWREVAELALAFIQEHRQGAPAPARPEGVQGRPEPGL